ncbi:MAG: tetratricopeptide repeat protein [Candidatus Rokuibacteriota bacterium]
MNEWRTVKGQAPKNLAARLALARAYERIGERLDALREYREILDLQPDHPGALQGLARLGGRKL